MDVMPITKFSIKRDADHSNSLFCILSVADHFLRLRLGIPQKKDLAEKCYDNDHEDAATGGVVCSGTNDR
jgi:hypothetical protein